MTSNVNFEVGWNEFVFETFGHLCMPAMHFINLVKEMDDIFVKNLRRLSILPNVGYNLVSLFSELDYVPPCPEFPRSFTMKLFCRLKLFFTIKYFSKEFKSVPRKNRKMMNVLHF